MRSGLGSHFKQSLFLLRSLRSAYASCSSSPSSGEPPYTTWKIREDGEHVQTLDYVFSNGDVRRVLRMPRGEDLGGDRLPSEAFASDHLSLVADVGFPKQ